MDPQNFLLIALKLPGLLTSNIQSVAFRPFDLIRASNFALVIADLEVKFIDGWRLIKEIKNAEHVPNVPTMLIGSKNCPVPIEELKDYGVADFLKLPAVPKLLMDLVMRTIQETAVERKFSAAKSSVINHHPDRAIPMYQEITQTG